MTLRITILLIFILAVAGTVYACNNPWKFVYTNGYALAVQQDSLLEKIKTGESIDGRTIRELRINWWVKTAYRTAPGNLPIRQYCIIDLARDKKRPRYRRKIKKMVDTLSCMVDDSDYLTWAESYSYWRYTNDALSLWVEKFDDIELREISEKIDSGFAYTSYRRIDGLYYPAPFGDLRDEPLDIKGQNLARRLTNLSETVKNQNVYREPLGKVWEIDDGRVHYRISAMPIGLNNHCDKQSHEHDVLDGTVKDFKYYEGYDKKYADREAEWTDMLDIRRLITIPFIW